MNKWPDGTPKSRNNPFDWRNRESQLVKSIKPQTPTVATTANATHTIYTKAVAAIGNFPPVAISRGERGATTPSAKT